MDQCAQPHLLPITEALSRLLGQLTPVHEQEIVALAPEFNASQALQDFRIATTPS